MAAVLIRNVVVSAVNPLLRLSRCTATPRALSTLLLGPPRATVTAGAGAKPGAAAAASLRSCLQPALGFKTKGVIKKRCRDCYFVKRRGRWFIYCKTNPKHKQRQM